MFDIKLIRRNKSKATSNIINSDFYQFICSDLQIRLESIEKDYEKVLLVDFSDNNSHYFDNFYHLNQVNPFQLDLVAKKSIDLVLFPFGLHWLGEVQTFLTKVNLILKKDGIFICNFPGLGSLSFLRKALFLAEESTGFAHFPHISPLIRFHDTMPLLRQAGFTENIIDYEELNLEYDSPIALMKALKGFGESNAIKDRMNYSITKPMYKVLQSYSKSTFFDQVNLINFISSPTKHSIKLKAKYFQK